MIREKQQKNKLIFFFFASLSTHVNGLNRRCRRCRRKQKKKKKKARYVPFYACVPRRARQLGNRNNTLSVLLYLGVAVVPFSFFPPLFFPFCTLVFEMKNNELFSRFFLLHLHYVCRRPYTIYSSIFFSFLLFVFVLFRLTRNSLSPSISLSLSPCTYHDLFDSVDSVDFIQIIFRVRKTFISSY